MNEKLSELHSAAKRVFSNPDGRPPDRLMKAQRFVRDYVRQHQEFPPHKTVREKVEVSPETAAKAVLSVRAEIIKAWVDAESASA